VITIMTYIIIFYKNCNNINYELINYGVYIPCFTVMMCLGCSRVFNKGIQILFLKDSNNLLNLWTDPPSTISSNKYNLQLYDGYAYNLILLNLLIIRTFDRDSLTESLTLPKAIDYAFQSIKVF